jgi:hypothetical protein
MPIVSEKDFKEIYSDFITCIYVNRLCVMLDLNCFFFG